MVEHIECVKYEMMPHERRMAARDADINILPCCPSEFTLDFLRASEHLPVFVIACDQF